jgi:ribosome-associated protein
VTGKSGGLHVPEREFTFVFSRASGPGGQNVNKVNTKVTLLFNVNTSSRLTAVQKEKIKNRLATRISKNGILRVVAMRYRTQKANKEDAIQRFFSLLDAALRDKPARKKMKISKASRERRIQAKKLRSTVKHARKRVIPD